MPNVQMPDGKVVSFPDSMSEDEINKVLSSQGGSEAPASAGSSWSHIPGMLGQAAINGGIAALNAPAQLADLGNSLTAKYLPDILTRPINSIDWHNPLGEAPAAKPETGELPTIPYLNNPSLAPQPGTYEPYLAGAVSGATSLLGAGLARAGTFALRKGLPAAENIIPTLARMGRQSVTQGAIPGVAVAGADQATQGQTGMTRQIADLATGAGAAILSHKILGSGNVFESIAKSLGDSNDAESSGLAAQDAIRNWKTVDMPAKISALKAPVLAAIPPEGANTDYSNTVQALHDMTNKGGSSQPFIDKISPVLPKQLLGAIQSMAQGGKGITATSPSGTNTLLGVTAPIQEAMEARSAVGNLKVNPKLLPGIDQTQVDTIYRALSQDIGSTFTKLGAGDEWNNYNKQTSAMYKAAENTLSKATAADQLSNETIKPETAANYFWNGAKKGGTDLATLRAHVPQAADEIAAGFLRKSPEKWNTLSKGAKEAMVPDPWQRTLLDEAVPHAESPLIKLQHAGEAGAGGVIGQHIGEVLNHGLDNPFIDPSYAALATAALPTAWRFGQDVVNNPKQLLIPAQGALAGNAGYNAIAGKSNP